ILPRRALQIGPSQEFQDDGHFAFGGPAARAGFGGRFRGILSRHMGSLRRPGIVFLRAGHAFSPLEHFLHKMFPMHCPTKSRAGGTFFSIYRIPRASPSSSIGETMCMMTLLSPFGLPCSPAI